MSIKPKRACLLFIFFHVFVRRVFISHKIQKSTPPDMIIIATYIRCDNLLIERLYRVCKVFVTAFIFSIGPVCLHSKPKKVQEGCLSCLFSLQSNVVPLEQRGVFRDKTSSRQRRGMSIETDAKVSELQRSAMCVAAGSVGIKPPL